MIRRASPAENDQDSWPSWLPLVPQSWSFLHTWGPPLLVPFSFLVTREYGLHPLETDQDSWPGWLLPEPYFVSLRGDVATAISRMFNPLIFQSEIFVFFRRTPIQFLDLTRKFFLMQARAHAKAQRNFVINRLSFLCLRSVDASSLSIDFKKPRSFPCSSDFKDINKVNIYARFPYLRKHFVNFIL